MNRNGILFVALRLKSIRYIFLVFFKLFFLIENIFYYRQSWIIRFLKKSNICNCPYNLLKMAGLRTLTSIHLIWPDMVNFINSMHMNCCGHIKQSKFFRKENVIKKIEIYVCSKRWCFSCIFLIFNCWYNILNCQVNKIFKSFKCELLVLCTLVMWQKGTCTSVGLRAHPQKL